MKEETKGMMRILMKDVVSHRIRLAIEKGTGVIWIQE